MTPIHRGDRDSDGIKVRYYELPWRWWLLISRQRDSFGSSYVSCNMYGSVFYLRMGRVEISLFRAREDAP